MKNQAWLVTIIVFLVGVLFGCGNFKVPPTMIVLLQDLNAGLAQGGWLMSMGTLAGIILALPAGGIMIKTGPKKLGIFSLICFIVGNIIGALASSFNLLLIGRLIEGIGFGLIGVIGPAIIATWFPPEKLGLPMGIWASWAGLGALLIFNITNAIVPAFGWRGDWWFLAIVGIILLILFAVFVKVPDSETESAKIENAESKPSVVEGLKSPGAWLLGIIFFCFNVGIAALNTFLPTFYVQTLNMDMAKANMISSLPVFGLIVGCIVMGFVLNKVRNRSLILVIAAIVSAICFYLNFNITAPNIIVPYLFIAGLVTSMIPSTVFTVIPDTAVSKATVGISLGIAIIGSNLGMFVGPIVLAAIVESSGGQWASLNMPLVVVGIIEILAAIFYTVVMKKKASGGMSMEQTIKA